MFGIKGYMPPQQFPVVKPFVASLGFFTRIPVGRDESSFDSLRRNLWILPITGFVTGLLIAAPSYLLRTYTEAAFVSVLFYILVEGINHIDGLADFGDSLFVPKERKLEVLKDVRTGVGGTLALVLYIVILAFSLSAIPGDEIVAAIVLSQTAAKTGMLVLLTTCNYLWGGMASVMMEYATKRDLIAGLLVCGSIFGIFAVEYVAALLMFAACMAVTAFYRWYVLRTYGGVNGDIIGALNCILFAFGLVFWILV
jgi:adenosylcobinamide-GDP ribazoletransferase